MVVLKKKTKTMGIFDKLFKNKKDIHKKNIEETPPPTLKFNNEALRTAVKVWLEDDKKAEAKYGHISNWDTSEVTDMSKLFLDAHTFNEPLNNWDVSKVTNMHAMFDNAYVFNHPLNNWDVSKVTDMSEMFSSMESLAFNQPIGDWDVSSVVNMNAMFSGAASFNQPIGHWDVSNVTNMSMMFVATSDFNQPIGNWNVSSVLDMSGMFSEATSFNQPIGNWDVSNVTNMKAMFRKATSFNQPIGDWDVCMVNDMSHMFWEATSFSQTIGDWDVKSLKTYLDMFNEAKSLPIESIVQDIDKWKLTTGHTLLNRAAYKEHIKDYKGAIVDYKKAIAANPSKTEFYRFLIDNCESEIAGIDTSLVAQLERSGIDLESIDSESGYNILTKALEKTTTFLNNRDSNTYDVLRSGESTNPDSSLLHDSLRNEIESTLETLTSREAEVIRLYFGLGNQHPMELDEIGETFKLTTERTRQIKEKAIRRIKHTTKSKILKTYLS